MTQQPPRKLEMSARKKSSAAPVTIIIMIESYTDSVQRYESVFTKQFADKGSQWDAYVNTDDLKEFTDYPLLVCPTRLLRDKKCPLFKRRSFRHDFEAYLNDTAGEPCLLYTSHRGRYR